MRRTAYWTAAAAATAAAVGAALAAPIAPEVPVDWQLEFTYPGPPKPIRHTMPGTGHKKTFWYFRFTVSNLTGEDQHYVPDFVLYTDTGQLLRAGQGVPTGVFRRIKKTYNDPLLENLSTITGKLLQGEDNAKRGVAIFSDIDPNAGGFDLFVGGISGDTVEITLPEPIEVQKTVAGGKTVTVRKTRVQLVRTLRLGYSLPGEASARFITPARLVDRGWVMR
jgi:hypothetical protein